MRSVLVTALAARADSSLRVQARQFLRGLSSDELQFIAGFLGACILESAGQQPCLGQLGMPDRRSEDRDLKMILLKEYLGRSGVTVSANGCS